jgi:hypothetical protein
MLSCCDRISNTIATVLSKMITWEIFEKVLEIGTFPRSKWDIFVHNHLEKINFSQYAPEITDKVIEDLVIPHAQQNDNELDSWEEMDREKILSIAQGFSFLHEINLSGCIHISAILVTRLLKECQYLHHLDLSRCSQFKSLIIASPHLRSLVSALDNVLNVIL